jgi:hypothetical protein
MQKRNQYDCSSHLKCTLTAEINRLHIVYGIPMKNNYSIVTMSVSTSQFQSTASKVIIQLLITGLQKSSFHTLYTVTTILLTLHFPKDKSIHAVYFLHASYVTKYRNSYTKILLPTSSCTLFFIFLDKALTFFGHISWLVYISHIY